MGVGAAFGFDASAASVAVINRLFAPISWAGGASPGGAAATGGAISVVSLAYVIFLNSDVDFERRYAISGLAAVVLLAFWLFMTKALILVGFQIAQECERGSVPTFERLRRTWRAAQKRCKPRIAGDSEPGHPRFVRRAAPQAQQTPESATI